MKGRILFKTKSAYYNIPEFKEQIKQLRADSRISSVDNYGYFIVVKTKNLYVKDNCDIYFAYDKKGKLDIGSFEIHLMVDEFCGLRTKRIDKNLFAKRIEGPVITMVEDYTGYIVEESHNPYIHGVGDGKTPKSVCIGDGYTDLSNCFDRGDFYGAIMLVLECFVSDSSNGYTEWKKYAAGLIGDPGLYCRRCGELKDNCSCTRCDICGELNTPEVDDCDCEDEDDDSERCLVCDFKLDDCRCPTCTKCKKKFRDCGCWVR